MQGLTITLNQEMGVPRPENGRAIGWEGDDAAS